MPSKVNPSLSLWVLALRGSSPVPAGQTQTSCLHGPLENVQQTVSFQASMSKWSMFHVLHQRPDLSQV